MNKTLKQAVQAECNAIYQAMMRLGALYDENEDVRAWLDARGAELLASSMDENALQWHIAGDEFAPTEATAS